MARYIDADALKERLEDFSKWCKDGRKQGVDFVLDCPLPNTPTADVVPKSEVERLNKELDELAEEHSDLIVEKDELFDEVERLRKALDEYEETSGLKQAKTEVAREIFADFTRHKVCTNEEDYQVLAELKKKYTGDQT